MRRVSRDAPNRASVPGCAQDLVIALNSVGKHARIVAPLAVVAVGLLGAGPLFDPRLIHGSDTLPHYYSLVQLDHLVRQGILYTRWFPHEASGFGAPFFQYYAPLAYYVADGFVLLGLEMLAAFRLAWGLTVIGSALGMYMWSRDILDDGPALVSATAYVCGPYMLFNAFFRGGYTEQFALMLMPWVLTAFRRLAVTRRAPYLAAGALGYALLHLVHTLTAVIFSPALLAYTIALAKEYARPPGGLRAWRSQLLMLWVPIVLGLGLSAFFWLPAFAERNALMTELVSANPALDYRYNFIPLQTLLSTPLTSAPRPALSLVAVGLAAVALLAQVKGATRLRSVSDVWVSALIAGGYAFLTLPIASRLWDAFPPLSLLQFPHRFLSVALLFLAFLAGVAVQGLAQILQSKDATLARWSYFGILVTILVLLVGQARVLRRVSYYPPLPEIDVEFIMQKEREAAPILGQFNSVFTPRSVQALPPLEQQAQDGPERLDLDSLPVGASLLAAEWAPLGYDLILSSPEAFSARFRTFYFPGWTARLDGQSVPIAVTEPHGQISVEVPAGEHHLVVWFGSTPIRTAASLLSLATVAAVSLAFLAMWYYNQRHLREAIDF
jgi:hypothetical protein